MIKGAQRLDAVCASMPGPAALALRNARDLDFSMAWRSACESAGATLEVCERLVRALQNLVKALRGRAENGNGLPLLPYDSLSEILKCAQQCGGGGEK